MLCFSADWHNPVQWSHYADKHKGVCLGFDVPDELLTRVRYTKMPPRLDWSAIDEGQTALGEAQMLRWLSTKYVHWIYENEWRVFPSLETPDARGLYFKDFDSSLKLRQILVGPMSPTTRADVANALNGLEGVEAWKTRLAFRGYGVVRQLDSSMWH